MPAEASITSEASPHRALHARALKWLRRRVQLEWAGKAGLKLKQSDSGYKDKKEFHTILRRKHGLEVK